MVLRTSSAGSRNDEMVVGSAPKQHPTSSRIHGQARAIVKGRVIAIDLHATALRTAISGPGDKGPDKKGVPTSRANNNKTMVANQRLHSEDSFRLVLST